MKKKTFALIIFVSILVLTLSIKAEDNYINLRAVDYDNPDVASIRNFDISSDGLLAIGFSDYRINVYSIDTGEFMYGYVFSLYGTYVFEFEDNNIAIYLSRENVKLLYSRGGELISVSDIVNRETYDNIYNTKTHEVQDTKYILKQSPIKSGIYIVSEEGSVPFFERKNFEDWAGISLAELTGLLILFIVITLVALLMYRRKIKNKM